MGETLLVDSAVLRERRVVNVYLPPDYQAKKTERYPVLLMLDGGLQEDFPHVMGLVDIGARNETMRPFILVGVENTERRRDLVGPTAVPEETRVAPHAGGSERFRAFLREELLPRIEARYRTTKERAVVGESLAGLFVVETLLVEPELFDTYIAIDPSVWWNHAALVTGASQRFAAWSARPKTLWVTTSEEAEMQKGVRDLVAAQAETRPRGLTIDYVPLPEEKHATIYHPAALRAFRAVLGPPKEPR